MNRSRSASLLPAFALALFLPVWGVAQSGQEKKQDSPTAVSANQGSSNSNAPGSTQTNVGKAQGQDGKQDGKQMGHGPTAIMDRATPMEKSVDADSSAKHPPTVRMDNSTPDQKSPPSTSSGNDAKSPGASK